MWQMPISLCLALSGKGPGKAPPRRRSAFRRPLLEVLEDRTAPATFPVTNTLDDGSSGSLRWAIMQANADTDPTSLIKFNIASSGVQTIQVGSSIAYAHQPLPVLDHPTTVDGTSEGGYGTSPLIELNGALAGTAANGLRCDGGSSAIKGLDINSFSGFGIFLRSNNNTVTGCYIGTDVTGTQALGNLGGGISVGDYNSVFSSGNTIGGTAPGQRNVISGNGSNQSGPYAVVLIGPNNLVQANLIGLTADGNTALGNLGGIAVFAGNNTIGGPPGSGAGNVVSGTANGGGIYVAAAANQLLQGVVIQGNYIGTNGKGSTATGTDGKPLGNGDGVYLAAGPGTSLVSGTLVEDNLISGNARDGITLAGTGNVNTIVADNKIGTDATGTQPLGNGSTGLLTQSSNLTIVGNVISANGGGPLGSDPVNGNGKAGITITPHVDGPGTSITVQGNRIGTDAAGNPTSGFGNWGDGVYMLDYGGVESNTQIGGTTSGAANIIAGNGGAGVVIYSGSDVPVQGNSIYNNGGLGIHLLNGANHNQAFPVITSATGSGSGTTVSGTLQSVASTTFRIEFFANTTADPSGFGQGRTYLGFTNVATDANGNVINGSFTASGLAPLPPGQDYLSATATNLATGDTSQFSQDLDLLLTNPAVTQSGGSATISFTLRNVNVPTVSYTINWGDGTGPTTIPSSQSNVSHLYTAAGIYLVQATATNQGAAPPATASVIISTAASDKISVSGGTTPGQVLLSETSTLQSQIQQSPTNMVVVSGSGGSDTYTVNFGSNLTTPITIIGDGATHGPTVDRLIVNGDSSSTNVINKTPGQITWGSPVTETVYRSGIAKTTINANGTKTNYVNDPGDGTTINGGPGTNFITITATTGDGVVLNSGPNTNNYVIDMGNLLGPVTINSTTGTCTVTVNGPPGSNVLTLTSTQLTGAGQTINFNLGTTATSFTVAGGAGNNNQLVVQGNPPGPLTTQDLAPTVGAITAPVAPTAVNMAISASATFSDLGGGSHTALWSWGDNTTSSGTVTQSGTSGTVTGGHTYTGDGVYTVTLSVSNAGGHTGQATFQYVVVYNPSAGFVTGGGWISSPAGAYLANPSLTGQANFGLNAKYQSGSTIPTGNTEFQFQPGNLNFHATSYDWLVLTTNQAQYQGSGTINGAGNYGFLVTALDNGGTTPDLFRIKIWDKNNNNAVVYDTQPGAATTAAPTTALGGGRIQVHTNAELVAGGPNPTGANAAPLDRRGTAARCSGGHRPVGGRGHRPRAIERSEPRRGERRGVPRPVVGHGLPRRRLDRPERRRLRLVRGPHRRGRRRTPHLREDRSPDRGGPRAGPRARLRRQRR
jgi:hypothetical protein